MGLLWLQGVRRLGLSLGVVSGVPCLSSLGYAKRAFIEGFGPRRPPMQARPTTKTLRAALFAPPPPSHMSCAKGLRARGLGV